MSQKTVIFLFMFIGSTIGGFVPMLWGDTGLSIYSVITTAIGGIFGIYIGFKISS